MDVYYTTVTGRRISNEDRHNIITNINGRSKKNANINFFSIYDGHGGVFVSNYLKKNIPLYYCNPNLTYPLDNNFHINTFKTIQENILKDPKKRGYTNGSTCLLNMMYYSG